LLFCCHGKENNQTVTYLLNARLICKASVSKKVAKVFQVVKQQSKSPPVGNSRCMEMHLESLIDSAHIFTIRDELAAEPMH
jgi:hypothetical protein